MELTMKFKNAKKAFIMALCASLLLCSVGCTEPVAEQSDETQQSTEEPTQSEEVTNSTEGGDPVIPDEPISTTTDFITHTVDIDAMLERPYDDLTYAAFSEQVFAIHTTGWGYDSGSLMVTGDESGQGMPVTLRVNGVKVNPTSATWRPSHLESFFIASGNSEVSSLEGNLAPTADISASYTSVFDPDGLRHIVDGTVSYNDMPRNRWSNYASGGRDSDSLTFDLRSMCEISSVKIYAYSDGSGTLLPSSVTLEYLDGNSWIPVDANGGEDIRDNEITLSFDTLTASALRITFNARNKKAVGATEIEIIGKRNSADLAGAQAKEYKFITVDGVAVSLLEVTNTAETPIEVEISAYPSTEKDEQTDGGFYILYDGDADVKRSLSAGETIRFASALSYSENEGENDTKLWGVLNDPDPLATHKTAFMKWFEDNIPYFDCDDEQLLEIYYFRWLTYRNNIRRIVDGWDGYIISEFLPNVSWAGIYNSISCAAGHHIYEGRWIKDQKYLDSYEDFWFIEGADPRNYSFSAADAYYARYLVTGDESSAVKHLDDLIANFEAWHGEKNYDPELELFYQIADRDGMEKGIGGDGYRPTINSYMYGDAMALSKIAALSGDLLLAYDYESYADTIKRNVIENLWDSEAGFFKTVKTNGYFVDVRELIGYIPWYYNLPDDSAEFSSAFDQLLDPEGFLAPYGPTTAEQRHPDFMKINITCCWDGPSWPFATSQTLTAAANLINNYENNSSFGKGDWFDAIKTYAGSQYKNGHPWLAEDLDGRTGEWIVDLPRGFHYNHSTFNDLVITGLVGLRADSADGELTVNPLLEEGDLSYFALENVAFRGYNVTVLYDADGSRYGQGAGLRVYIDGALAAEAPSLESVTVELE